MQERKHSSFSLLFLLFGLSLCLFLGQKKGDVVLSGSSPISVGSTPTPSEIKTDSHRDSSICKLLYGEEFEFSSASSGVLTGAARNSSKVNTSTTLKNIFIKGGNTINISKPFGFVIDCEHYSAAAFLGKSRFVLLRRLQI